MKAICQITLALLFSLNIAAQPEPRHAAVIPETLNHPRLVERFYLMRDNGLAWYDPAMSGALRQRFLMVLDSAGFLALDKNNYHYRWLKENTGLEFTDSAQARAADKVYTDAAISFCKDLYRGAGLDQLLDYDELSPKYEAADDSYILVGLSGIHTPNELDWFLEFLQPADREYLELKQELRKRIDSSDAIKIKHLGHSINQLRYIRHFNFSRYVVVNPASAVVRYYSCDTVQLRMKAVVGKKETPTPRFSGYCNSVILYPYWHVPHSIAVNEILPLVKRNPAYLENRNLQVLDRGGTVLDPGQVNWAGLSARNFPYQFRQSTGCDNALGVIKFNLTDPFSVYMHDTNGKTAFLAGSRYFSHGCIRLEKPMELAMAFLPGKIDAAFLESCREHQKPVQLRLDEPVPVFVMYMTTEYDQDGKLKYYRDVYQLLQ